MHSYQYGTSAREGVGIRCKKNNIPRGIKEFVRVVIMSSCSGTILSIFCDLREIQRRYCRLYLGIRIYRQSTRIIFGARVACSLLWNTLTILYTSCVSLSFAELVALSTVEEDDILGRDEYTTSAYATVRPDVASDGRKTTSLEV